MFRSGLWVSKALRWVVTVSVLWASLSVSQGVAFATSAPGAVYVQTNQASGNSIAIFDRSTNGKLTPSASVPTGGLGTGASLGSARSVILSVDGRWLFAVNAGSNDISAFSVTSSGLNLVDRVASGGIMPTSLALYKNLLYVLNAGGSGNINGFSVDAAGNLTALSGSTRPLSGPATAPAQISFSTDGSTLVVTEKATSLIDTYAVGPDGLAVGPISHPSSGATPYGFGFTQQGVLVVSEAVASAASSYDVSNGQFAVISASVLNGQAAACWIAVSRNGKFAYSTNAGTGTVSAYRVGTDGSLSLVDGSAGVTGAGTSPTDAGISVNGQYLYVLNGHTHNLSAFAIRADGTLKRIGTFEGLPASSAGIAVW